MKITHCISSIDESTGGPARSVTHLVEALGEIKVISEVNLLTIKSENPLISQFFNTKLHIEFYASGLLQYSSGMCSKLRSVQTDLFHGHGIWQQPVHQMAIIAREKKLPYIVSVRGMLEPWSLTQSMWKKKLAMLLFQHKDLKKAACIHATGGMEVESVRKLGYKNPIAMIPNGIDLLEYPLKNYDVKKEIKKILFLSRIHPKKGIEHLINSWEKLDRSIRQNWKVEVAGNGESDYINQLNELIKKKSLQNEIRIVGPKFGKDKIALYHSADLFVLPTYSENFGIVIAEALASGVPVITTKGTPWDELETYNAGKWIDLNEENLLGAMSLLMNMKEEQLQEMGENGRKLIEENYSIESVAEKFVQLYQWILTGKNKPDFVYE